MNLDQFRARPLVVTVKELCPCCNVLKEDVQKREHKPYFGLDAWSMYACESCFESAKKESAAAIETGDYYAW